MMSKNEFIWIGLFLALLIGGGFFIFDAFQEKKACEDRGLFYAKVYNGTFKQFHCVKIVE